jgi:alanine dehydrogenase
MKIGVPKEIKNGEFRVALTPQGAADLVAKGHQIYVEHNAGTGAGFDDVLYETAGAVITSDTAVVWDVELVVKVKEPLPLEYMYLRPTLGLFTYLHLASAQILASKLLEQKVRSIAYETVSFDSKTLPLLVPMSQIAGRVAMSFAAHLLQKNCMGEFAGKGLLLGGIEGVTTGKVVIIGGGNVGKHAAQVAVGLGADVTVLDQSEACLVSLDTVFKGSIVTELYTHEKLQVLLADCDVLIVAALVAGERAPQLLTKQMIGSMQEGSLFVDVAIDQGGMSETSRPTSYNQPTYMAEGVVHCCLPNLPSAVARSSTQALTHVTFPYIQEMAELGIEAAVAKDYGLTQGINTWDGELKHEGVKKALSKLPVL